MPSLFATFMILLKALACLLILLATCVFYTDAWILSGPEPKRKRIPYRVYLDHLDPSKLIINDESSSPSFQSEIADGKHKNSCRKLDLSWTHNDVLWKIRPPPETPWYQHILLRFAANGIRLDCALKGASEPLLLCPKGGQAVLEAWTKDGSTKVGRFGITTEPGPLTPPIQETVQTIYGLDANVAVRTAAIIYMFVEEDFRKRDIGVLALQVISLIHAYQGCDFTVLVADDKGSGRLIEWYGRNGFALAPNLQDIMGSPDRIYGTTMIGPTNQTLPYDCQIKWW
jgi:GNAT superfamily N-acetyltransferase